MAYQAKVLNVMIASPGDVTRERILTQEIIAEWNSLHAERFKLVLLPLLWELDAYPETGDRAQAIINRQLVDRADVLVAIFWSRLGSPTGKEISGTVEEIRTMIARDKPVMIYSSATPVVLDSVDMKQYESLKAFLAEMKQKGLLWGYKSHDEFSKLFFQHLTRSLLDPTTTGSDEAGGSEAHNTILPIPVDSRLNVDTPRRTRRDLTDEAATLLLIAAKDPNDGQVLIVRTFGGTHIRKRPGDCLANSMTGD